MKLLLDQNLADRLVADLERLYPDTQHLRRLGMETH
jgi:predicted nuclease of predicted toxin-antitoxin system